MTKPALTAANLIELRKAQQRGQAPAGPIIVHDLAVVSGPDERSMTFDPNQVNPTVIVRTTGNTPFFIERIELLQPNANERLGRYELVEKSPWLGAPAGAPQTRTVALPASLLSPLILPPETTRSSARHPDSNHIRDGTVRAVVRRKMLDSNLVWSAWASGSAGRLLFLEALTL